VEAAILTTAGVLPRVRSRRHCLAQMAVHEDTDSTNKRNYNVILGMRSERRC